MLNYAYAILESQVKMQIVAQGLDPTIGYLDANHPTRTALVYDLMEPLRPVVDQQLLRFVQKYTFAPGDFTIRNDGVCRLNPALALMTAAVTSTVVVDLFLDPLCHA